MRRLPAASLEVFAAGVFRALGAPPEVAAEVARHLVLSNLSGHDTHGLFRIPLYVGMAEDGALVPSATPVVLRETAVSILVDARRGFGQYATAFTLERCLEKAGLAGVGVGTIRHSTHTGRLGTYAEAAAERGFVCLATTGSAGPEHGSVVPFGGARRFLDTNPWTVGVPAGEGRATFVYDAATSAIAGGKVRLALSEGMPVPDGTLLDAGGHPTRDPQALLDGGSLRPLGAPQAAHKGSGFSLAAALLGALGMIDDPDPTPAGIVRGFDGAGGVFLWVLDPALFGDAHAYAGLVARTLDRLHAVPPLPGVERVLHAGEPEAEARRERTRDGIPISDALWAQLAAVGERFAVPLPD